MHIPTGALSTRQGLSKKLIIGFAALAGAAIVSTIGMAKANQSAQPLTGYGGNTATVNANIDVHAEANDRGVVYVIVQPIYNFFSSIAE